MAHPELFVGDPDSLPMSTVTRALRAETVVRILARSHEGRQITTARRTFSGHAATAMIKIVQEQRETCRAYGARWVEAPEARKVGLA